MMLNTIFFSVIFFVLGMLIRERILKGKMNGDIERAVLDSHCKQELLTLWERNLRVSGANQQFYKTFIQNVRNTESLYLTINENQAFQVVAKEMESHGVLSLSSQLSDSERAEYEKVEKKIICAQSVGEMKYFVSQANQLLDAAESRLQEDHTSSKRNQKVIDFKKIDAEVNELMGFDKRLAK